MARSNRSALALAGLLLAGSSLAIPIADGRMMLGTWQGVFIAEHRREPHTRTLAAHVIGD